MDNIDMLAQQVLKQMLTSLQPTGGGVAFRHDIGDPSYSPNPAFLFAPHGDDSVRVYWNEFVPPLAQWFPVIGDNKEEETYEFLSYFVPNLDPDDPGVQDGNVPCANCGSPSCSSKLYPDTFCDSFGKTAGIGPVYRYNVAMGRIHASSATVDWTRARAMQNRGAQKTISFRSWLTGQNMTLTNQRQIFAYLANLQWMKIFHWSLWGGTGFNGSFPGVLETVRPGWARENEYRIHGAAIPDNAVLDPAVIDLAGVPYYDQPWLFAERVQQVVTEMTLRGQPPVTATVNGIPNVLADMAFVASPEWFTHFAKLVAKTGMLNDYSLMPNSFNVSINPMDTEQRFLTMARQGPGWWGFLPTPYGNVPFIPEFYCDPRKIPADGCQRSNDECDTSDTYSTTMRLLVRRSGAENILGLRYLNFNETAAPPPSMQAGSDYIIGDSGRWITTYPVSTNGLCDRAMQMGYAGMFNAAPTLQTIFTGGTYRSMLEPHRYTPGSQWFRGGTDLATVTTATRSVVDADPVSVSGTITTITGGNGIWTIVSADLDGLDVVPVGTKFQVGSYIGHVSHYSDDDNSITVLGDLSLVTDGSDFLLGNDAECTDCPSTEALEVLQEEDCVVVRATFNALVEGSVAGYIIELEGTVVEALTDQDLLGGYVYIAGALVGRVAHHDAPASPGDPAVIYLNYPTNVPIGIGDAVVIYVDSGCESDEAEVESLQVRIFAASNIPLTDADTALASFVSSTGATTSVSLVTGYPQPDGYVDVDTGNTEDMLVALEGLSADTGGDTVWVDLLFESDQVAGVFARVRVPYNFAALV